MANSFLFRSLLYSVLVTFCLSQTQAVTPNFSPIVQTGPISDRINLVFLAEGFTQDESSNFLKAASDISSHFLKAKPFDAYTNFFNSFAIFVASPESGSDHPSRGVFKTTYFNSRYDSYGTPYEISIPPNETDSRYEMGVGKIQALLNLFGLTNSIPILLVNDKEYGGQGGVTTIASMHTLAGDLVLHEFGHSFTRLWEEYEGTGFGQVNTVNNTSKSNLNEIPWNYWIEPGTPIPTPETETFANTVGFFEGAGGYASGTYRPQLNCRMRSISAPFCNVCSEAIILKIYERTRAWPSFSPIEDSVNITKTSGLLFIYLKAPSHPNYSITWLLDGKPVQSGTNISLLLQSSTMQPGQHTLSAQAKDQTTMVRRDPFQLLSAEKNWSLLIPENLLTYNFENSQLVLSWNETLGSYRIQGSSALGDQSTWGDIPVTKIVDGSVARVSLPLQSHSSFFRLVKNSQ